MAGGRDVLRFLWVDDVTKESPEIIVMRFTCVIFGVSSSPNATIKHHLEKFHNTEPEFVELFLRSIYVDGVSYGTDNKEEVFKLYLKSKQVLAKGGFNLQKFATNSPFSYYGHALA